MPLYETLGEPPRDAEREEDDNRPQRQGDRGGIVEDTQVPLDQTAAVRLEDLPNIGPSIAGDLRGIGVQHPRDLFGRDAMRDHVRPSRRVRARHLLASRPIDGRLTRTAVVALHGERKRELRARGGD